MKRTKINVHVQNSRIFADERVVLLGEAIIKKWKVPAGQTLSLKFGSAKHDVKVASISHPSAIRMSESLASKLGLSSGRQVCFQYKPAARTIHIGPLIGVMVSRVIPGSPDRPFGTITSFCREMTDACEAHGAFVYFFTPDDITSHSDTVKGYTFSSRWTKSTFPVPHVIYNRLTSRRYENRPVVQQFMQYAKTHHRTSIFNEKYLNKNEVFDALKKESSIQVYLPESHLLKNSQTLKSMCSKYATVFLKPITGSLGKGIIRIKRQSDGSYICHLTSINGVRKQSYPGFTQLFSALSGKIKTQRFQIQQGLDLISVAGRPVDFRALVQRGETGQWGVTSIVGRIAGNHHFVSNLARGGSLTTVKDAVSRSNSANKAGALLKLQRASLQIAKGVETQIDGHFAELGVDLAMDTSGRVWLLEVNSKPSKDDNSQLSVDKKVRPSVRKMVQYARSLAKF
ncbi:YheC/YheD family protein [Paenibacillus thalictri]|uniref:YheC/YheD family protein n=1 Tax=Paenibacillus thalictri TaxID=2527873 RepID=A0A4Q9DK29_9BACL|nr:YheC/YheD family protein [Paenibacillus thalictri]TBL75076.1 YheC/YheD family protein [Paenibacillus thalictri]